MKYYFDVLRDYVKVHGRSRRSEFWTFNLVNGLYFSILFAVNFILFDPHVEKIIIVVAIVSALPIILPTITVSIRRLHDTGRSGWWMLINFVPVLGTIIFFFWMVEDSLPGLNEYGEYPKFKLYF